MERGYKNPNTVYSEQGVVVHIDFIDLFIVYFIEKSSFFKWKVKKSDFLMKTRWFFDEINDEQIDEPPPVVSLVMYGTTV